MGMSFATLRSVLTSALAVLVLLSSAAKGQAPAFDELTRLRDENQRLRAENQRLRELLIKAQPAAPTANSRSTAPVTPPGATGFASPNALAHWLTVSSGKRHNSSCRYFKNGDGRPCTATEGTACKICGG